MAHDRRALLRAGAFALLVPALGVAPRLALARGGGFAPPAAPMLYTRRLERALPEGARFMVSRSFAVHFHPQASGFCIEGEQVAVDVEAPIVLAEFAQLERTRQELALFPIQLDATGLIAQDALYSPPRQLEEAVEAVLASVARLAAAGPAEMDAALFASAVRGKSEALVSHLPPDLFAPAGEQSSATRRFVLPGGDEGEVSVTYRAEADPATGLMRTALREVVTRVEGTSRRTVENWTLAPHP